jgi:hypothetical protein
MASSLIYDGSGTPSRELKLAFSQGRVDAHTSRDDRGWPYYDVRAGQNAFIPEPGGKAYFAGEEVPEADPTIGKRSASAPSAEVVSVPAVASASTDVPRDTSQVSVQEISVTPLNDAAKKNAAWKPGDRKG